MQVKATIFADRKFQISIETEITTGRQMDSFRQRVTEECGEIMFHLPKAKIRVEFETDGGTSVARAVKDGDEVVIIDN